MQEITKFHQLNIKKANS